jgi:hypothetical protein
MLTDNPTPDRRGRSWPNHLSYRPKHRHQVTPPFPQPLAGGSTSGYANGVEYAIKAGGSRTQTARSAVGVMVGVMVLGRWLEGLGERVRGFCWGWSEVGGCVEFGMGGDFWE